MNVTKVVIPAAGFGTRFLPVTKARPKEMMPLLDKPTIQYVVEEAVDSGIDNVLIITGREEQAVERHLDKSYELEEELSANGKTDRLERVRRNTELAEIHHVRQQQRQGLVDTVRYARQHAGDEPFALLLGDTIIESGTPCTGTIIQYANEHETSVVSPERVPWDEVSKYGVVDLGGGSVDACFPVDDFMEKPPQDDAPSNLAITGRYVFRPEIFDRLEEIDPRVSGELQLTDAIRKLDSVRGIELAGDRYDIGNIPSWLRANFEMALRHDDGEMNESIGAFIERYTTEQSI